MSISCLLLNTGTPRWFWRCKNYSVSIITLSAVFDVDFFERDMDWYFSQMLYVGHNTDCIEALALLKGRGFEPSPIVRCKVLLHRAA